jgi:hypothetical protein
LGGFGLQQNVSIPLYLLKNLISLLEYWDVSLLDRALRDEYWGTLSALRMKLHKLDLRVAYSKIVKAPNEDARHMARIEYLRLKNILAELGVDD